jgi:hypothetical protein
MEVDDTPTAPLHTAPLHAASAEEAVAIARYKNYQRKHIPNVRTIEGLYPGDPELTREAAKNIDIIERYIVSLAKYTKRVVTAARLRQSHYDTFVQSEDPAHREWRLGMNSVAAECERKLAYYKGLRDENFSKFADGLFEVDSHAGMQDVILTARNVEYARAEAPRTKHQRTKHQRTKHQHVVAMSEAQRGLLREEYKRQLVLKNVSDFEFIDEHIDEHRADDEPLRKVKENYSYNNIRSIPASDFRDLMLVNGLDKPSSAPIVNICPDYGIAIIGTYAEMIDLSAVFYSAIIDLGVGKVGTVGAGTVGTAGVEVTTDIPRIDHIIDIYRFVTQIGIPCTDMPSEDITTGPNDPPATFTSISAETIMNLILNSAEAKLEYRSVREYIALLVSRMSDDNFIFAYKDASKIAEKISTSGREISAMSIPAEHISLGISVCVERKKKMISYINVLRALYPSAIYMQKIKLMLSSLSNLDHAALIFGSTNTIYAPPKINYKRIKSTLGFNVVVDDALLSEYRRIRGDFQAAIDKK